MKMKVYEPYKGAVPLTATPKGRRARAELIVDYYHGGSTLNERVRLVQKIESLSAYIALNGERMSEQRKAELSAEMLALEKELKTIKENPLSQEEKEILIDEQLAIMEAEEEYEQTLEIAKQRKQERVEAAELARKEALEALKSKQQESEERERV